MSDNGSLQSYITADIQKAQADEIQKIPIPRFGGRLVIRYKAVDARTLIKIGLRSEQDPDEVNGVITASVDALIASCDGSETDKGEDLGKKLGMDLAAFLGYEGSGNPDPVAADREGVYLIFDDELSIVNTANKLKQFQQLANQSIGDEIVKNSEQAMA